MKPKIYISGKITGLDYAEAFAAFEAAEKFVESLGYEAINPMKLATEVPGKEWIEYMVEDLRILDKCDGIFMMSNWRDSDGARLEREFCLIRKKRILYETLFGLCRSHPGIKDGGDDGMKSLKIFAVLSLICIIARLLGVERKI